MDHHQVTSNVTDDKNYGTPPSQSAFFKLQKILKERSGSLDDKKCSSSSQDKQEHLSSTTPTTTTTTPTGEQTRSDSFHSGNEDNTEFSPHWTLKSLDKNVEEDSDSYYICKIKSTSKVENSSRKNESKPMYVRVGKKIRFEVDKREIFTYKKATKRVNKEIVTITLSDDEEEDTKVVDTAMYKNKFTMNTDTEEDPSVFDLPFYFENDMANVLRDYITVNKPELATQPPRDLSMKAVVANIVEFLGEKFQGFLMLTLEEDTDDVEYVVNIEEYSEDEDDEGECDGKLNESGRFESFEDGWLGTEEINTMDAYSLDSDDFGELWPDNWDCEKGKIITGNTSENTNLKEQIVEETFMSSADIDGCDSQCSEEIPSTPLQDTSVSSVMSWNTFALTPANSEVIKREEVSESAFIQSETDIINKPLQNGVRVVSDDSTSNNQMFGHNQTSDFEAIKETNTCTLIRRKRVLRFLDLNKIRIKKELELNNTKIGSVENISAKQQQPQQTHPDSIRIKVVVEEEEEEEKTTTTNLTPADIPSLYSSEDQTIPHNNQKPIQCGNGVINVEATSRTITTTGDQHLFQDVDRCRIVSQQDNSAKDYRDERSGELKLQESGSGYFQEVFPYNEEEHSSKAKDVFYTKSANCESLQKQQHSQLSFSHQGCSSTSAVALRTSSRLKARKIALLNNVATSSGSSVRDNNRIQNPKLVKSATMRSLRSINVKSMKKDKNNINSRTGTSRGLDFELSQHNMDSAPFPSTNQNILPIFAPSQRGRPKGTTKAAIDARRSIPGYEKPKRGDSIMIICTYCNDKPMRKYNYYKHELCSSHIEKVEQHDRERLEEKMSTRPICQVCHYRFKRIDDYKRHKNRANCVRPRNITSDPVFNWEKYVGEKELKTKQMKEIKIKKEEARQKKRKLKLVTTKSPSE